MDERTACLQQLYAQISPRLLGYLARQIADPAEAEELLHDTFVAAASNMAGLLAAQNREAWLFGIARNLARARLRQRKHRASSPLEDLPANAPPEQDQRVIAMRDAIHELPEAQRDALQMRLVEDMSYAEIAEAMSVPIGTVRSRIHHAVMSLRRWAASWTDETTDQRHEAVRRTGEKTR